MRNIRYDKYNQNKTSISRKNNVITFLIIFLLTSLLFLYKSNEAYRNCKNSYDELELKYEDYLILKDSLNSIKKDSVISKPEVIKPIKWNKHLTDTTKILKSSIKTQIIDTIIKDTL